MLILSCSCTWQRSNLHHYFLCEDFSLNLDLRFVIGSTFELENKHWGGGGGGERGMGWGWNNSEVGFALSTIKTGNQVNLSSRNFFVILGAILKALRQSLMAGINLLTVTSFSI